jgi:hypothetical protein
MLGLRDRARAPLHIRQPGRAAVTAALFQPAAVVVAVTGPEMQA